MKIYTNTVVFDDQVLGSQHLTIEEAMAEAIALYEEVIGTVNEDLRVPLDESNLSQVQEIISDALLDLDTVVFCDIAEEKQLY
jgi:hypothetical protein